METTVEYAETHLAQLLRCVERGEEVILRAGANPVARLVPFPQTAKHRRPQVGEITSAPVRWDDSSFAPLDEAGMKAIGLL
jgi:antitoxin (DNA-binding transcriptional repressor) of toxin-antitoxin stability system